MARYIRTNYTKELVKKGLEDVALKEAKQMAGALFATVNKRINRIIESGEISPAVEGLRRTRGNLKFTTGGKDLAGIQKEWAQAVAFYNLETSTLGGARNFTNKLRNVMGERVKDKEYVASVFDLLHGVEERLPLELASNMIGTNDILNNITEIAVDNDISSINADTRAREKFITEAIEKLTEQIDKTITGGISELDDALAQLQSQLF